ncbi:hypothetical protein [Tsukamurella soli]
MYVFELIAFRCNSEFSRATYTHTDGNVWWRAPIKELQEDLGGLTERPVRASLDRLATERRLVRERHLKDGPYDRTWSYRPSDENIASCDESVAFTSDEDVASSSPSEGSKKRSAARVIDGFSEWYQTYPRHIAKASAAKAYGTALKKITPDLLLASTAEFAKSVEDTEQRFIPYPASWLNGERWSDFPVVTPEQKLQQLIEDKSWREIGRLGAGSDIPLPPGINDLPVQARAAAREDHYRAWVADHRNQILSALCNPSP